MLRLSSRDIVRWLLFGHIALTFLDNLPSSTLSIVSKTPLLPQPPQWKFFAPNPGVENYYVFYRLCRAEIENVDVDNGQLSDKDWKLFPISPSSKWYGFLWNSGSRRGKALFDVVQQVRILAGYSGSYEWARQSQAFHILERLLNKHIIASRPGLRYVSFSFQFMITGLLPAAGSGSLKPIAVSPWIKSDVI